MRDDNFLPGFRHFRRAVRVAFCCDYEAAQPLPDDIAKPVDADDLYSNPGPGCLNGGSVICRRLLDTDTSTPYAPLPLTS